MIRFQYLQLSLCVSLLCFCGCPASSGDIGLVEGVVTLDGAPVDRASVRFFPADGRASSGKTDKNGHYDLRYTRNAYGAVIGQHKVTISTEVAADNYDSENSVEARAESIPKKYRDRNKTGLTENVECGRNTINFDLTSGK